MFGAKSKNDFYFTGFVSQSEFTFEIADKTRNFMKNFAAVDPHIAEEQVHVIEHNADQKHHEIMDRLAKEFIPPLDREDIVALSQRLDDLTDAIEDIMVYLYIYNVKEIRQPALQVMDLICSAVDEIKKLLEGFYDFKNNPDLEKYVIDINGLEEVGDKVYHETLHNLFADENETPKNLLIWPEMYSRFETVLDTAEDVANLIESIIMKNS